LAVSGRPLYFAAKRTIDIIVSSLAIVFLLPAMLLVALWIKLDSSGPVLFRQERVGRGGRLFTVYKFRTMSTSAPAYALKISSSDPCVTRVGRFLRLSCLDELPQLLNVLRGEMSLVGPRPELAFIVEMYEPWQRRRHEVTPGITGWWQIHHRDEVPMHQGIDYDLYYLEHAGPRLDLFIAVQTVTLIVSGVLLGLSRSSRPN
jgi:lipopolysaccharide/colanic/teichoic acid biosynthesis glycosyltransferase